MGSCRVGVDPKHSVVARWNRVHGISNLFVVDGSIIYNEWSGQPHIKRLVPWLFVPQKVFGRHVSSGLGAYFVLTSKPAALGRGWKNVAPKAPGKPDADWPPLTA
jgi:hypothetical protein